MLELHCHTTYSDGLLTPTELVKAAHKAGVKALAITDHDTISAWDEAQVAAQPYDLEIIPGVELSTVYNQRSLHILGFYPNPNLFIAPLNERLQGRKRRATQILAKLADLGYPVELPPMGDGMAPARPHIAQALVKAGYVRSAQDAFKRWLGEDKPAYVAYEKFSAEAGIQLLRDCDGVPVWAHPYLFRGGDVDTVLPVLVEAGLMGLEVYHPNHSSTQVQRLEQYCDQYGLIKTGGSDYHGGGTIPLNAFKLPLSLLSPLQHLAQGR